MKLDSNHEYFETAALTETSYKIKRSIVIVDNRCIYARHDLARLQSRETNEAICDSTTSKNVVSSVISHPIHQSLIP